MALVIAALGPMRPADWKPHLLRKRVAVGSGCWLWTGHIDRDGYGVITREGHGFRAHRAMYEIARGPIPTGLQLDHLCRNRRCVNPEHLEAVTNAENHARGSRATLTHCLNGHPFDETNTYHRPTGGRGCRACKAEQQRRHT